MKKTTMAALFIAGLLAFATASTASAQCTTFRVFNNTGGNIELCLDYGPLVVTMAPCFTAPPGFSLQPAPVVGPPPGNPIGVISAGANPYAFGGGPPVITPTPVPGCTPCITLSTGPMGPTTCATVCFDDVSCTLTINSCLAPCLP